MRCVNPEDTPNLQVAAAWDLVPESIQPLGSGLINRTFHALDRHGTPYVLQQLNPVFPPEVNEDIEAVTAHLAGRGLLTPRLVRARDGRLWLPDPRGVWRLMTHIDGRVLETVTNEAQAAAAGGLLARFHRALDDLAHDFRSVRPPVHEPARHLRDLERALETHRGHRLYAAAATLAEEIFAAARALSPIPATPPRVVHGDPKITNLVFAAHEDRALCMLDLDTLGRMALPLELGDAFRSWCNVASEDDPRSDFSVGLFAAATRGYGAVAGDWLSREEIDAMVDATATIQVELAARFCADILNESYFGWNPRAFPSRGEHNLARARGQLNVHRSLVTQRARLEERVARAFPSR